MNEPPGPAPYGPPPGPPATPAHPAPWPPYDDHAGWSPDPPVPARAAMPHELPREYHHIQLTRTYAWWRPAMGIPLLIGGFLALQVLGVAVIMVVVALTDGVADLQRSVETAVTQVSWPVFLVLNLGLAGLILVAWALQRGLHGLSLGWVSSVVPRLRWRLLAACLGAGLLAIIAGYLVAVLLPGRNDPTGGGGLAVNPWTGATVGLLLVTLLTTPLQVAGEEYAFRGYLLQAVGALARHRWATILLTALLFAVVHLQFDPPIFLDRLSFGIVAAWLTIRTGGLEAAIGLHVVNNLVAIVLAVLVGDLGRALTAPEASYWYLLVTLVQDGVSVVLVLWLTRRMDLQTRSASSAPQAPGAALEPA